MELTGIEKPVQNATAREETARPSTSPRERDCETDLDATEAKLLDRIAEKELAEPPDLLGAEALKRRLESHRKAKALGIVILPNRRK